MAKKDSYVLGLAYFGQHDSAAALLKNGRIVAAAEEERFTRIKFDRSFPRNSIKWCLKSADIDINEISNVGFFWKPWRGLPLIGFYRFRGILRGGLSDISVLKDLFFAEKIFRRETGFDGKFHHIDHHLSHAASSFFASGFESSAIMSIDGRGEVETSWLGEGNGEKLKKYSSVSWPHSLGYLYSAATEFLGFKAMSDEYKVMALASYSKPEYIEEFRKIAKIKGDKFSLDMKYLNYQFGGRGMFSEYWVKRFGLPRKKDSRFFRRHYAMAASVQLRLEEIVFELLKNLIEKTRQENLCLAGGVFLNSVLVGKIASSGIVKRVYTTPASGDTGCALGAAYYVYRSLMNKKKNSKFRSAYLGTNSDEKEFMSALSNFGLKYKMVDAVKTAPELMKKGHVVGWFQGGSEFGQRALGNRSILADPRDKKMKDRVNRLVKYRESFRPFAPAVLKEYQSEYFQCDWDTPYMTEVHPVVKDKKNCIPSVIHVDGTARLQTVTKNTNPRFWKLINNFKELTGVPVVLNTSFNVKGEPIVDSPADAIKTFLSSGIDDLFLGDFWVKKPNN